jgi:hypothetical protein
MKITCLFHQIQNMTYSNQNGQNTSAKEGNLLLINQSNFHKDQQEKK